MNQSTKNDDSRMSMEFIITILETLAQLKHRWKFIAGSIISFTIIGVVLALTLPQSYRSEVTIVIPQSGGSMGLGGLASLAGGELGDLLGSTLGSSSVVSEELVTTLLNSGELADEMVPKFRLDSSWKMPREKNTREDYRKVWSKKFRSEFNKESALRLDFLDRSPVTAQAVVEEVTRWLDQRAQKVFKDQAERSYQYYKKQQDEQYALLTNAEDSLLSFQIRNRNFVPAEQLKQSLVNAGELESEVQKVGMLLDVERGISGEGSASVRALELRKSVTQEKLKSQFGGNATENSGGILKKLSPAARQVLEYERLKRRVLVHASVYAFLVQQSEQLKLESVKTIPMFTVIDAPIVTTKRAAPPRRMVVQLFFTLGFLMSCSWVLLQEYIARNRSERFQAAWNKFRS